MDANDPQLIQDFLTSLPATVQNEILLFVIVYGLDRDMPGEIATLEPLVLEQLSRSGMAGIGTVLRIAAVLDYVMEVMADNFPSAEAGLKQLTREHPENSAFQTSLLSLPMRQRHMELARAAWRLLRGSQLTPPLIRNFAEDQMMPRWKS